MKSLKRLSYARSCNTAMPYNDTGGHTTTSTNMMTSVKVTTK